MAEHNQEPALEWPLAAYGKIIRGDETTSEDQVAEACSAEMARRIVACVNGAAGIQTEVLERDGPAALTAAMLLMMAQEKAESFHHKYRIAIDQRNTLLAALKDLVNLAELGDADQDEGNWRPALIEARAVIAAIAKSEMKTEER